MSGTPASGTIRLEAMTRVLANGRFATLALALASGLVLAVVAPALLSEQVRDWKTFAGAAERLAAGRSLYFEGGTVTSLYPPAMAIAWSAGMGPLLWRALDLLLAVQVAWVAPRRAQPAVAALVLLQAPLVYDLLTGNMMGMFAGALAIRLATRRFAGAVPLGIVVAIAIKPFMLPVLVALLVVRPRQALQVGAVAAAITALAIPIAGIDAHVEYVRALLAWTGQIGTWINGNLGTSRLGAPWPLVAIVVGTGVTAYAVLRRPPEVALAVAVCAGFLLQPSLGYYYAVTLLIPLAIAYRQRPAGTVVVAMAGALAAILSPVITGIAVGLFLMLGMPGPRTRGQGPPGSPPAEAQSA